MCSGRLGLLLDWRHKLVALLRNAALRHADHTIRLVRHLILVGEEGAIQTCRGPCTISNDTHLDILCLFLSLLLIFILAVFFWFRFTINRVVLFQELLD